MYGYWWGIWMWFTKTHPAACIPGPFLLGFDLFIIFVFFPFSFLCRSLEWTNRPSGIKNIDGIFSVNSFKLSLFTFQNLIFWRTISYIDKRFYYQWNCWRRVNIKTMQATFGCSASWCIMLTYPIILISCSLRCRFNLFIFPLSLLFNDLAFWI